MWLAKVHTKASQTLMSLTLPITRNLQEKELPKGHTLHHNKTKTTPAPEKPKPV